MDDIRTAAQQTGTGLAMVPLGDDAYLAPSDGGDARLVCRHGGLTADEMLVPLLAAGA